MSIKYGALITLFSLCSMMQAGNKIVYLISPPRCLSTACMRTFEARKDFAIINEPAWYAYNLLLHPFDAIKNYIKPEFPILYPDVIQMVLQKAQTSHVLVKEISFAVEPFLLEDQLLVKNPDVYFIFLIRDPHAALISFAKKRFREIPLQKFGYRASYQLFQKVKAEGANAPLIIRAEEMSRYPEAIMPVICALIGIPFKPESLEWPDLGNDFTGYQEWAERKDQNFLYHWHDAAIHSTGFKPLATYAVDANGYPTFQEVAAEDLAEVVAMYNLMFPFYQALLQEVGYRISMADK